MQIRRTRRPWSSDCFLHFPFFSSLSPPLILCPFWSPLSLFVPSFCHQDVKEKCNKHRPAKPELRSDRCVLSLPLTLFSTPAPHLPAVVHSDHHFREEVEEECLPSISSFFLHLLASTFNHLISPRAVVSKHGCSSAVTLGKIYLGSFRKINRFLTSFFPLSVGLVCCHVLPVLYESCREL